MNRIIIVLCSALLLSTFVRADDYTQAIADQHIIPAYQKLADTTAKLDETVVSFCAQLTTEMHQQTRSAFNEAFLAWQGTQHIRFGPIELFLRAHRIQMWPDKRGSVGKHLRRFMATADVSKLDAESFRDVSVAVQGFSAMERLLFDRKADLQKYSGEFKDGAYCPLLLAIANNLRQISADMLHEWNGDADSYRELILTADYGNMMYEELRDLQSLLLNNLHAQLKLIDEQKLMRPLGKPTRAYPKRSEAWRSALSLLGIIENIHACRQLYALAFQAKLNDEQLDKDIQDAFSQSLAYANVLDVSLAEAVASDKYRSDVVKLRESVSRLKVLIAGSLAKSLNLSLGFNSLDGD